MSKEYNFLDINQELSVLIPNIRMLSSWLY